MLFPTLNFLLFFIAVALLTALSRRSFAATKLFLVAASYVFYACWNWRFCFLLAFSSLVSYAGGRLIVASTDPTARRRWLTAAIAIHLGVLGLFKYFDFFVGSLNDLAHVVGLHHELPFFEIVLPVGISFFTFHGISYLLDVHRGHVPVCRRP